MTKEELDGLALVSRRAKMIAVFDEKNMRISRLEKENKRLRTEIKNIREKILVMNHAKNQK